MAGRAGEERSGILDPCQQRPLCHRWRKKDRMTPVCNVRIGNSVVDLSGAAACRSTLGRSSLPSRAHCRLVTSLRFSLFQQQLCSEVDIDRSCITVGILACLGTMSCEALNGYALRPLQAASVAVPRTGSHHSIHAVTVGRAVDGGYALPLRNVERLITSFKNVAIQIPQKLSQTLRNGDRTTTNCVYCGVKTCRRANGFDSCVCGDACCGKPTTSRPAIHLTSRFHNVQTDTCMEQRHNACRPTKGTLHCSRCVGEDNHLGR